MAHRSITRRLFIRDVGRGVFAVAVLGAAACATEPGGATTTSSPTTTRPGSATTTSPPTTTPTTTQAPDTTTAPPQAGFAWQRVNLGFVSAYVLAKGTEAVVVDTGVEGSAPDIAAGLAELGLGWSDVGHVILTHLHGDHIGSLGAVMEAAQAADGYAGAADIPAIGSPRPLAAVGDGDEVVGLQIIETPGHTAGSISVHDPVGGVLVAGDALNGSGSGVAGPNAQFTDDMAEAIASVRKLAGLQFDTVVFGHGDPVVGGASAQVAALAETL